MNTNTYKTLCFCIVPETGLEPVRPFERESLSLLRLPIPPLGLVI